ncbi:TPA: hypothetical protein PP061_004190 [Salmonella bongori]|uniref:Holin n=1 Tax=Salmonella bongori N268-08 TaxID=1197719 RepID=S5NP03_SALBN|nr:phage holin family protein [Salmonella bongori]AGR61947.1 hypothetical protein A464_plas0123 [Salmonella bongori N268-08]ECE6549022.1 hypothetical protein [Salmonella bongori]ECI3520735.1 hypothetical protein [Salmonella bongori]EDP8577924.1 hypothetical protein [Salmonella bongori]EDP8595629.1 hypothetical protein [Salmonella bongori]
MGTQTTEFIMFLPYDFLINIILLGGWGGIVNILLKRDGQRKTLQKMLRQITVSGFVSILISLIFIKEGFQKESILIGAGVGGVSGRKILEIIIDKISGILVGGK